jgi:hypothetical protein
LKLFKKLNEWRKARLWVSPGECHLMLAAAHRGGHDLGFSTGKAIAESNLREEREKVHAVFHSLQTVQIDANTPQHLTFSLRLDRSSLVATGIPEAAKLLAARTETLYRETLEKRMNQ